MLTRKVSRPDSFVLGWPIPRRLFAFSVSALALASALSGCTDIGHCTKGSPGCIDGEPVDGECQLGLVPGVQGGAARCLEPGSPGAGATLDAVREPADGGITIPTADAGENIDPNCIGKQGAPSAGRPCGCKADCDEGESCKTEEDDPLFARGVCYRKCESDADCPDETLCGGGTYCMTKCNEPCGDGRICGFLGPDTWTFACFPRCGSDADCPISGQCDVYTGYCGYTGKGSGDGVVGEACEETSDCRTAACFTDVDPTDAYAAWTGGLCSTWCSLLQSGSCPDGSTCVEIYSGLKYPSVPEAGKIDQGYCLPSCTKHSDCRFFADAGYTIDYLCMEGACQPALNCCRSDDPCNLSDDKFCTCFGDVAENWDKADCDCCGDTDTCGLGGDGLCECASAAWDAADCTLGACQESNPLKWNDDDTCDCDGKFAWDVNDCGS